MLDNNSKNNIDNFITTYIGTSDRPLYGPSYILNDGKFLKMTKPNVPTTFNSLGTFTHKNVQKTLFDNNLIDKDEFNSDNYALDKLGCIRINSSIEEYISLPEIMPSEEQWKSLIIWLDWYFTFHKCLQIIYKNYNIICDRDDYINDIIIKKCKLAYITNKII